MSELSSSEHLRTPYFELAGSMQAVLNEIQTRDFSLDIQQTEAFESIAHAIMQGKTAGYVEMATSTGKTPIEALVAEAAVRAGKRVLLLAPKIAIARQISGRNQDKASGLAKFTNLYQTCSVGHHFGKVQAAPEDDVVISTYDGFRNDANNGHQKLGEFDVVIGDECHRSLGAKTAQAISAAFPGALKLGFSATPDFAIDRTSDEIFSERLFEFSLIDAIELGKTAPLRALVYETNEKLELYDSRSEFTERELAPLIENLQRNGTAHQLALDFVKDRRQGIIACISGNNNVHARLMADTLSRSGIVAADIGSHLSPDEQIQRLKQYQNGDIDVLTFTRALEEGWDSDNASFCINMAPTSSPVRTKQLIGRLLRKNPDGRESIFVDFVDSTKGVFKTQYTAMHALDMETIDVDRVLGRNDSTSKWNLPSPLKKPIISRALYERLLKSNGKQLSDVTATEQKIKFDPLVRKWERTLEKEKLSTDLPENIALSPRLEQRVNKAYQQFVTEHDGLAPTAEELMAQIGSISNENRALLARYAFQLSLDTPEWRQNMLDIADDGTSDPHEIISNQILNNHVREVLDTLSEREAGVIAMRVGLFDGEPKDLDKIGKVYGITRERVRQIESKTMSKLRHPSRSDVLKGYLIEAAESRDKSDIKKNQHVSRFDKTNKFIRIFDKFTEVGLPPALQLTQYIAPQPIMATEGSYYRHTYDDSDKPVLEWRGVKAASETFAIIRPARSEFDASGERIQMAIDAFENAAERLNRNPTPTTEGQLEQRTASIRVYESRVKYLRKLQDQLTELKNFLEQHMVLSDN